jgi:hypothetical protein
MITEALADMLRRVETWSPGEQDALADLMREMDDELNAAGKLEAAERAELLRSLDEAQRAVAAGDFDVLGPDTLRRELEAILDHDASDAQLDAMLKEPGRRTA